MKRTLPPNSRANASTILRQRDEHVHFARVVIADMQHFGRSAIMGKLDVVKLVRERGVS